MGNSDHEYDGIYVSKCSGLYYRVEGCDVKICSDKYDAWHYPPFAMELNELAAMVIHGHFEKLSDL